jgi:excinuclease UvrABC ATPase subunit
MQSSVGRLPARSVALTGTQLLRRIRGKLQMPAPLFKVLHSHDEQFECPICSYSGPFATVDSFAGSRKHAACPQCRGLERHRLQHLVLTKALHCMSGEAKMLHVAPEKFF